MTGRLLAVLCMAACATGPKDAAPDRPEPTDQPSDSSDPPDSGPATDTGPPSADAPSLPFTAAGSSLTTAVTEEPQGLLQRSFCA